ncbi:glycosyltransferase N-terminal domain-containing protein [Flavobacterium sp.]|uniref:3-deoxy-D-manno-octulosonic acid transferase n=1 Tax=Flavobacterium sp. TaxID=239 RepID=UPI00260AFD31|nr:glycosyltransferase N-terminal domain-containing protein [Flavobacterium sp.]MDG2432693.1 glycosyltransferase N-terminal domain-containing protein [Flavobacterium sp.]
MLFLYNILTNFASSLLPVIALFAPKIKLFVDGRKEVFKELSSKIKPEDLTIWFHAASLGEYEQGLPVIESIKTKYPSHKIIISFFSPSGYEVRKNNIVGHATVYLPLDTKSNAKEFIKAVHPDMVFFIKYEFWPNYLNELKEHQIPTYLVSGIFRENQLFFKWYGAFYVKALDAFTYFFVQNEKSKNLLVQLGKTNVAVSGDTRFDRVATILEKDNSLSFIAAFKNNKTTLVAGSTWPKDEALLTKYINQTAHNIKVVIAPHNIKKDQIASLKNSITKKTVLYSDYLYNPTMPLAEYDVFIIDTIGILTKIYSYADIAYVGGGFGNPGVHNILEPATFGIPIIIGPNYSHFAEATALIRLQGCRAISNAQQLKKTITELNADATYRTEKGHICSTFVTMNKGATNIILNTIAP